MTHADILLWALQVVAWAMAAAWVVRAKQALDHFDEVADIGTVEWGRTARSEATLVVVVPACNEQRKIRATLESLVAQEHAGLQIVAVNDRSTDRTGRIMDALARRHAERLQVMHITELAPGWLGKTHAMAQALAASESEYVLFTDADILFSPSVLRRALAYADAERADHLVVAPTVIWKTPGEAILMAFFQFVGFTAARPWKVRDPKAKRDVIGIGAFNLVRRTALGKLGGLAPQRLAVLEDITLARRMKAAGMRSRVAFAPGLVLVHWASGVDGLVRVMTKNLYSVFGFRWWLMAAATGAMVVGFFGPIAMLVWKWTVIPGVLILISIAALYKIYSEVSAIPFVYAWGFPVGAAVFLWALVRSAAVVTWRRGVMWRGTFYPLRGLKVHNSPWRW